MGHIYTKYLNRNVFLLTSNDLFYNGPITEIDVEEKKLSIMDRKWGEVTLDFKLIVKIEPREEKHV